MDRIGIEDVRNAYRLTGLQPAAGIWEDRRDGRADPVAALVRAGTGRSLIELARERGESPAEAAARALDLPVVYVSAFADAVDGRGRSGWGRAWRDGDPGYDDGCAVVRYLWGSR